MSDSAEPIKLQTLDFVDREEQIDVFIKMVSGANSYRVYLIEGQEGIGKSYLFKEFQAQCKAAGIACARVLPEIAKDTNYMSIVLTIWEDLQLGSPAELYKQIALARASRIIQKVKLPDVEPGEAALAFLGNPTFYGNINAGEVAGSMNYQMVMQTLSDDHDKEREEVKEALTPFLKECLANFTRDKRLICLIDPWEAACQDDQTMEWLLTTLVKPILEGELPNAALAIAGGRLPLLTNLLSLIYHKELGRLPDKDVSTYWVDKCTLPPEDLPEVIKISNGIPQVLSLTAEQARIGGRLEPGQNLPKPTLKPTLADITGVAIEALLRVMPAELVQAIRLCAIPHWFNKDLFFTLVNPPGGSLDLFNQIAGLRFVTSDSEGFYRYSESVRGYLFQAWWQPEKRPEYIEKCQAILTYLQGPDRQVSNKQLWSIEQEILYFRLIADETSGIQLLCDRFEIAARHHQLDLAEQYIRKTGELESFLSERGKQWLRFFEARVRLFKDKAEEVSPALKELLDDTQDPVLQAAILGTQGRILISQQQWSQAARKGSDALKPLRKQPSSLYGLLIRLMLAETYCDLANNCGDFHPQNGRIDRRQVNWLDVLQHLPFMIFESLIHRWSFLPNWYFGTNYQDWLISYLFMEAARWYRQAESSLEKGMDPLWAFEIQLGLARVEHQLGRWSKVQKRYAELDELELVQKSACRKAFVDSGSGQALAEEGKLKQAAERLEDALPALDHFKDWDEAGAARSRLSQVYRLMGKSDQSAAVGLESVRNFQDAGRPIQATQMVCSLEDLLPDTQLKAQVEPVKEVVGDDVPREYLARFPDKLLRWYKQVSFLGAIPLTYFLFIVLSFLAAFAIAVIDGEIGLMQAGINAVTTVLDVIVILGIILVPIPLTLWLYRFFYSLIGLLVVFFLGRRLAPLESEQPRKFIIGQESIKYTEKSREERRAASSAEDLREMPWGNIQRIGMDSYALLSREISLVSRTILVPKDSSQEPVEIDGITSGYDHLKRDIQRRVQASQPSVEVLGLNFQLLNPRWTAASILFCLAVLGYLFATNRICGCFGLSVTGEKIVTQVGPAAFNFLPTLALILPVQILWRSLFHSWQVAKKLDRKYSTITTWQQWFGACFTTLILLFWLAFILTQKVCTLTPCPNF